MRAMTLRLVLLASSISLAALARADRALDGYVLVLADARTGETLRSYSLEVGEEVLYRYIHSVEEMVTEEGLELGPDGELYLMFSRSPQHGLGHIPREGGLSLSTERLGWQEARGFRVPMTPFVVFTSSADLADMTLVWRRTRIALSLLFPERHLEVRVDRRADRAPPGRAD